MNHNPIICAIDTTDHDHALHVVRQVAPYVGAIKLGLEFFVAHGARGVQAFEACNIPIFLDLKFHDIPNTVAKAIHATAGLNVFMITVHCAGGIAMLEAAREAAHHRAQQHGTPYIVGVTVLTSMDQQDIHRLGIADSVEDHVQRLALMAQQAGLDGVVCSSHEIEMLRRTLGSDALLVVPGIRPMGSEHGDQKRVMTPQQARTLGANYMVIGRPITHAPDPASAARDIMLSLS
ncbi:MAG: orotidine-5'-phosphate decarboxylase [Alphaproteobacteria bacterium]|nr:MAG: orotidine-5'-phosphate decarboxylase [Alphaproteobacteria bacterium]